MIYVLIIVLGLVGSKLEASSKALDENGKSSLSGADKGEYQYVFYKLMQVSPFQGSERVFFDNDSISYDASMHSNYMLRSRISDEVSVQLSALVGDKSNLERVKAAIDWEGRLSLQARNDKGEF